MRRNSGSNVLWFLAGVTVGAAATLVLTPVSGAETRRFFHESGRDYFERGRELYEQGRHLADEAADMFEDGRRLVEGETT